MQQQPIMRLVREPMLATMRLHAGEENGRGRLGASTGRMTGERATHMLDGEASHAGFMWTEITNRPPP